MRKSFVVHLLRCTTLSAVLAAQTSVAPAVGEKARDFALASLEGNTVRLSEEIGRSPVVLVVLRGWPGYDCPFCTRQFADYLGHAVELEKEGARVLFVYPGPADGLKEHAEAFLSSRELPRHFTVVLDPEFTFTNAYALRWEARGETAYPSTFVIDKAGTVRFANISKEHGGRVPVADVLKALAGLRESASSERAGSPGKDKAEGMKAEG
jgi:peroxiredoxin Q/BCP